MSKMLNPKFYVLTVMIFVAALFRMLPHPPNVAPLAAMALFGGAYFTNKKAAFLVPFAALFVTDLFLGFHNTMISVYVSFAAMVGIGMLIKNIKITNVVLGSLASSIIFFVVTNFAVWNNGVWYPRTLAGLAECYVAAIPFFNNTLLGDLFFVGAIFGTYELLKSKAPQLIEAKVKA